jgi:enamine deaminase RidA (YjgF/YER057c/UK114 family)
MIVERLAKLGYTYQPATLGVGTFPFHSAVRVGDLVFTSGQVPNLDGREVRGRVGVDLDLAEAKKAAEICAFNCLRAVGAVADIESVTRIVKVLGMVNVGPGFDDTSGVINGCSEFLREVFGEQGYHARSAVGMVLPSNWAVEVEMVVSVS